MSWLLGSNKHAKVQTENTQNGARCSLWSPCLRLLYQDPFCTWFFKSDVCFDCFKLKYNCIILLPPFNPFHIHPLTPNLRSNSWPLFFVLCYIYELLSSFSVACMCMITGLTTWNRMTNQGLPFPRDDSFLCSQKLSVACGSLSRGVVPWDLFLVYQVILK